MPKYLDDDIRAMLWNMVFVGGSRRALDLIIALHDGWVNIAYENNDYYGQSPECETSCREVIPYVHNSESKLLRRLRQMTRVICLHENESVTIRWSKPATYSKTYDYKTVLDNLLYAYMEVICED
jgi:hypothetical protein